MATGGNRLPDNVGVTENNQDLAREMLLKMTHCYELLAETNIRVRNDAERLDVLRRTGTAPAWRRHSSSSDTDIVGIVNMVASMKTLLDDITKNVVARETGVKEVVQLRDKGGRKWDSGYNSGVGDPQPHAQEERQSFPVEGVTEKTEDV